MNEINDLFDEFQRELDIKLQKLKYQVEYSYDNKMDVLLDELKNKEILFN